MLSFQTYVTLLCDFFFFFLAVLVLHCSAQDSSRILELAASGAFRLSSYDTSSLLHHAGLVSCPTLRGVLVFQLGTDQESLRWKDWTTKESLLCDFCHLIKRKELSDKHYSNYH